MKVSYSFGKATAKHMSDFIFFNLAAKCDTVACTNPKSVTLKNNVLNETPVKLTEDVTGVISNS